MTLVTDAHDGIAITNRRRTRYERKSAHYALISGDGAYLSLVLGFNHLTIFNRRHSVILGKLIACNSLQGEVSPIQLAHPDLGQ
jgi:hypothetical protein